MTTETTRKPTTIIHVSAPGRFSREWQVFANYDGDDDRYTFSPATFADEAAARRYAAYLLRHVKGSALATT